MQHIIHIYITSGQRVCEPESGAAKDTGVWGTVFPSKEAREGVRGDRADMGEQR